MVACGTASIYFQSELCSLPTARLCYGNSRVYLIRDSVDVLYGAGSWRSRQRLLSKLCAVAYAGPSEILPVARLGETLQLEQTPSTSTVRCSCQRHACYCANIKNRRSPLNGQLPI